MALKEVRLYHFRNLRDGLIDTDARTIILQGENGQGKTNFLEAVYMLCYGSSFRTKKDRNILCKGEKVMAVKGLFTHEEYEDTIKVVVEKRKKIECNNTIVKDRKDIIALNPSIPFCHGDIRFVNGSAEEKRTFFDQTLSFFDPDYISCLRQYNTLLKERNAALRLRRRDMIDIYSVQLSYAGDIITKKRTEIIDRYSVYFSRVYEEINRDDANILIKYKPSFFGTNPKEILNELNAKINTDMERGFTGIGVHRDNYEFTNRLGRFVDVASTGQTRIVSLILKMAQARFIHETRSIKPILLFDDVLLEIDKTKRERILNNIPPYEQIFFTFLPQEQIHQSTESVIEYRVENGELIKKHSD